MKKILLIISILLVACTNTPVYNVSPKDITFSPLSLELKDYSGEIINFTINNPSALCINLIPDIVIYTKIDNKEYIIQRKNEITIRPSANFSFSFGAGKDLTNETSLGIIIENTKEYLIYNNKDLEIKPLSDKTFNISINTKNLYYIKDNKDIPVRNELLYGYINFYDSSFLIKTIPFQLNLQNIVENSLIF